MQQILKAVPDERLRAYIVWLPMFPGDARAWAQTRSDEFSDKRLSYYWDGARLTGQEWQRVLGLKPLAWDVYFLYGATSQWEKEPAAPAFWMHQLSGVTNAPSWNKATFEAKVKDWLNQTKR